MQLISKSDIDAIQTANLLVKTNMHRNAYRSFQQSWIDDKTKLDNAFLFAFCSFILYKKDDIETAERYKYLFHAMEALTDCLDQSEDWWIARFLRINALQANDALPNSQPFKNIKPKKDLEELIRQQAQSQKKEPYFLCPYIISAKSNILKGKLDEAANIIEMGFAEVRTFIATYALDIFMHPFIDIINCLRNVHMDDYAERVKYAGITMFPRSVALAQI